MYGPLELLVIQSSPFCNLDCKYCYLPNRKSKEVITIDTVKNIFKSILNSDIVKQDFTTTWHAGEPLTVSKKFYESAFEIVNQLNNTQYKVKHNFQSNGTLINQEWCDFIKQYDIHLSISIDGTEDMHNRNRVDLKGNETHFKVMKAIDLLHKNEINFSTISVISDYTLDFPDEFYSFFKTISPNFVGLNLEEIENYNLKSSLFESHLYIERYAKFINKLFE